MELKAQYDLDDLLDLVEQDLEAKGFRLVSGFSPVINGGEGLLLTLANEQLETRTISPALPALPAPAPAATVTRAAKPQVTQAEKEAKRQEALKKARGKYAEKKKAEKLTAQVKQTPSISTNYDKEFQDRVLSEINELKGQSSQQQEVVAPTTSPFQVSELLLSNGLSTSRY
jgi:hypothetical protein